MGWRRATGSIVAAAGLVGGVLVTPALADSWGEDVDVATAVAGLNAACAATGPMAASGLRATYGDGDLVAAYNPATATMYRRGRETEIWTATPLVRYLRVHARDRFLRRGLDHLGTDATWMRDTAPAQPFDEVMPSPAYMLRWDLKPPGVPVQPMDECASSLIDNPEHGFVWTQRQVVPGQTSWRIIAGATFYGLDEQLDNGVQDTVHVNDAGVITQLERGFLASDGIGAVGEPITWEYGVQPEITVPTGAQVVELDKVVAARASFLRSDLIALARRVTGKPLDKPATVKKLQTLVRWSMNPLRLDPDFPSGMDRTRDGAVAWQRDTVSGTVFAVRFFLRKGSDRVRFRPVDAGS